MNKANQRFYIHGSHGSLTINGYGDVLEYDDKHVSGYEGYGTIYRIDIPEYERYWGEPFCDADILDVGYWSSDAKYVPPVMDWREEIKARFAEDTRVIR